MQLNKKQMIQIIRTFQHVTNNSLYLSNELDVKNMEIKMLSFLLNEERKKNEKSRHVEFDEESSK